ncbi:hypothetical protein [uncultured Draconibacterium sp.]|uniref:hypothetical protein n=1 Tax=uncultured Draconibacterium sp. TaxID=1573823 RepID=UPI002AA6CD8B|nr:hypothetical protein [uncultured Draconibacterium sp.]
MFKGEPSSGVDFFNLLMENEEFNKEIGKLTLAAGRLEAELIRYYKRKDINENLSRFTLGKLIEFGKNNDLLERNLVYALENTCKQRNYITHNIYALFTELIDETVLPKNDLIDTDVLTYTDKAWETRNNLINLADLISKY